MPKGRSLPPRGMAGAPSLCGKGRGGAPCGKRGCPPACCKGGAAPHLVAGMGGVRSPVYLNPFRPFIRYNTALIFCESTSASRSLVLRTLPPWDVFSHLPCHGILSLPFIEISKTLSSNGEFFPYSIIISVFERYTEAFDTFYGSFLKKNVFFFQALERILALDSRCGDISL